jgi:5-methylcytosine-specific restriction endonuclease McrA
VHTMISSSVLVLNRSWIAVHIADVRRALSLVYRDLAKVVAPDTYATYDFEGWKELSEAAENDYIRTVSFKIKVPEIIVLTFFNGFYHKDVRFSRRNIFERDRNTCQYCGTRFSKMDLTIDHVVPRSRGGKDTWENVVLACVRCNVRKGDRLPGEAGLKLIQRPARPQLVPYLGVKLGAVNVKSWEKFVSMAYWDVELKE